MYIVSRNLPIINILIILLFILIHVVDLNNVLAEDCALSRTGTHYKGCSSICFCLLHEPAGRLIQLDLKMSASNRHSITIINLTLCNRSPTHTHIPKWISTVVGYCTSF